ncbi:MAG TPA: hypothetical protein VFG83_15980 [Kofleriaceae bacterium]|nr:hypothetical protein [Kofleriaceae bacterium]
MPAHRHDQRWKALWEDFLAAHRAVAATSPRPATDPPGTAHALVCGGDLPAALRPSLLPSPLGLISPLVPDRRVTVTVAGELTCADRAWWRDQQILAVPSCGSAAEILIGLGSILAEDPGAVAVIVPWSLRVKDPDPIYDSLAIGYLMAAQPDAPIVTLTGTGGETGAVIASGQILLERAYHRLPGLVRLVVYAASLPARDRRRFLGESMPAISRELDFWTSIVAGLPNTTDLPLPARAGWHMVDERDGARPWPATRRSSLAGASMPN